MSNYDYDLIIIGSGPSGRAAAIQAGKLKRRVLVIDRKDRLGGVSVHTGTIPSKTLRETVLNLSGWRERSFYGRSYRVKDQIRAEDLKARLHMTLDHEVDVLEHQFNRNHVETLNGLAKFVGPHEVEVATDAGETTRLTAAKFLIATGTKTYRPDYVPFNGKTVVDGDDFLEMAEIPRSLVVIGAGVIGVEYATMFSALDVRVTLIEPRETFLDFIDKRLIHDFTHQIRENGVDLRLGSAVEKIEDAGGHVEVTLGKRPPCAGRDAVVRSRPDGRDLGAEPGCGRSETDHRNRIEGRPQDLSDRRAAYLCNRRCDRAPVAGLNLVAAGAGGGLPCAGNTDLAGKPVVSLWHLFGARDFHLRHVRGRVAGARHSL